MNTTVDISQWGQGPDTWLGAPDMDKAPCSPMKSPKEGHAGLY
jgi:hypothetical protein